MSRTDKKVLFQIAVALGLFGFYYPDDPINDTLKKLMDEYSSRISIKDVLEIKKVLEDVEKFGRENNINAEFNFLLVFLDNLTQEQLKWTKFHKRVNLWLICMDYVLKHPDYNKITEDVCANTEQLTEYVDSLIQDNV